VCLSGNSILDETRYSPAIRFWNLALAIGFERLIDGELNMKKLVLALSAVAAFTGSAIAADMAPRYSKAPPPVVAPVASWTGCYLGGGGGYGLFNQESTIFQGPPTQPAVTQLTQTTTEGGRGWFGTVQGGCDYQFSAFANTSFVVGAFADADFGSLKANIDPGGIGLFGREKMSSAWAVGGRIGWVALPGLLTYFSAGYTEATFDQSTFSLVTLTVPNPIIASMDKSTFKGFFIGAGDEYALNFLPGLF
jgi:outer membrane immunogenic protein